MVATAGVDIGGADISVLVLDGADAVLGRAHMRTPGSGDRTAVLEVLRAAVADAAGDAGISHGELDAIGVGTPGVVVDGTVGGASNVAGFYERFSLAQQVSDDLGLSVRVVNDVSAAALGEHCLGAGRGFDDVLVVFVGTGVGGGLILGGEIYEGKHGGAGEFGHTVVVRGGAVCPCGRRGCVEAYAGRRAMAQAAERAVAAGRETILFKVMEELERSRPTSLVFKEAFSRGDQLVADLLDEAVAALGAGIASAVNLLDVQAVVLGGSLADRLAPHFLGRVEAAARPHLFLQPPHVHFAATELGHDARALGAAILAREVRS